MIPKSFRKFYWLAAALVALAVLAVLFSCAGTNDKAGDAALVGAGAAAGSAAGGSLWAGVAAGGLTLWNWLGGGDGAAATAPALGLFGRLGALLDSMLFWAALIVLAWLAFPRTRGVVLDLVGGLLKAPVALVKGDVPAAKEAAADAVLAAPRLAGFVGEKASRRIQREVRHHNKATGAARAKKATR